MSTLDMDELIANSYMDFHQKGFHYLCLRRAPTLTEKFYFFDGDVSRMPEVVAPHDHRYQFLTKAWRGTVENRVYTRDYLPYSEYKTFQRFSYMTPLNGGNGFTWAAEEKLYLQSSETYFNRSYWMAADDIHTIQIREAGTILKLYQFEDVVPINKPTSTWTLDREPPNLSGLYRKPTPDEIISLLSRLEN